MLGSRNDEPSRSPVRRPIATPEKALHLHITMPDGSSQVNRRLARKIRDSITRTLAQENAAGCDVFVEGEGTAPARTPQRSNKPTHAAPGCGAWWNF